MPHEREDVGEAQKIGDQQDQEDEHGGADQRDDHPLAGRQPVDLAGDLTDLAIRQARDPRVGLLRVDAVTSCVVLVPSVPSEVHAQ